MGEGTVSSLFVSSHLGGGYLPLMGEGVPTLGRGEGVSTLDWEVPTLDGEGVPTLDRGVVPTFGQGGGVLTLDWGRGTYLGQGEGLPTLDGGGVPTLGGEGVPTFGRESCGQYASCGFPQENFLVVFNTQFRLVFVSTVLVLRYFPSHVVSIVSPPVFLTVYQITGVHGILL